MTTNETNATRSQVSHCLVFQPGRNQAWVVDHDRETLERFLAEQDRSDIAEAAVEKASNQVPVLKDPRGAYCIGCGQHIWALADNNAFLLSFAADGPTNRAVGIHTLCESCSGHDVQELELFVAQIVHSKGRAASEKVVDDNYPF